MRFLGWFLAVRDAREWQHGFDECVAFLRGAHPNERVSAAEHSDAFVRGWQAAAALHRNAVAQAREMFIGENGRVSIGFGAPVPKAPWEG